ncbi:MAG: hypothetical protein ISS71_03005 [Phycisphaerae bacterium]|nr:hypothetical protein [Phycisphaerae bacterium]
MKRDSKHHGYAILIVLIAVAILLLLYATQMKTLFVPNVPKQPTGIEQRPWLLEDYLVAENESVKLPRSPKPQISEAFALNGRVTRDNAERGTVVIHFDTDGRIRATWTSEYTSNEQTHALTAEMDGNINVKQTYEDPNGKDKSRLFFIAKGPYLKKAAAVKTSIAEEKGTAWLIGWLKPDHTADGYITITTDRKWSAVYELTALPVAK